MGAGCHFYKNPVCWALLKIEQFKVAIGLFFPLVTYSLAQPASNYNDKINKSTISYSRVVACGGHFKFGPKVTLS